MTVTEELQKLEQLRLSGALDDNEFAKAKARVLGDAEPQPMPPPGGYPPPPGGPAWHGPNQADPAYIEQQANLWGMLLHLSLFAGLVVPLAGYIAPIVIWIVQKDNLPRIDEHGKIVVNWIISEIIYLFVAVLLCLTLIGIVIGAPLGIAVVVVGIVFPIMGAVKANNGKVWRYPMSITFLK